MHTAEDVAKRAGVSKMTVSRVMNGHAVVSEKTREKVLQAAKELDYQPNLIARSLVTKKTNTIGILMTGIENPIYSVFLSSIIEAAKAEQYDTIVSPASDMDGTLNGLTSLLSKGADGIIILSLEFRELDTQQEISQSVLKRAREFGDTLTQRVAQGVRTNVPIVFLGQHDISSASALVDIDYYTGAHMAVDYLAAKGHRNIGYLHHDVIDEGLWQMRYQGFLDGMRENDLSIAPQWMIPTHDTVRAGQEGMNRLLSQKGSLPTAIVCANDTVAVGAMNAAAAAGLQVPEEISILGQDGSAIGENTYPQLTTISIQPRLVGTACFEVLHSCMQSTCAKEKTIIEPALIERGTVRKNK